MEKEDAGRFIIDAIELGFLTVTWNKKRKKAQFIHDIIQEGQDLGFLIEVCSGCGKPTKGRDCGCPAGTSLSWKK